MTKRFSNSQIPQAVANTPTSIPAGASTSRPTTFLVSVLWAAITSTANSMEGTRNTATDPV